MNLACLLFLFSALPVWSRSALVNVTIDNKYGDPRTGVQFMYSPNGAWYDGPGCTTCRAQPDPNQAYNGTWVDSTFNSQMGSNPFPDIVPTASVNFTGSAVYVYCIMANSIGRTFLTFLLDGQVVGGYAGPSAIQNGDGTSRPAPFDYNVLVYSNTSLVEGTHSFMLQNGVEDGPVSLVLFDYLTYSTHDTFTGPSGFPFSAPQRPTASARSSRVMLVAIVFSTTGVLAFIVIVAILCHRLAKNDFFTDIEASFKLPSTRLFRRRSVAPVTSTVPPSFSPSRLVQRISPEPVPMLDRAPLRQAPPVRDHHASLPADNIEGPLVPRRRGDTETGGGYRSFSMAIQQNRRNSSLIPAISHQQTSDASEPDIASQIPPSSDDFPPPTPPVRNSRPPRRLTVRNN